jgi:hypothetical protein
VIKVGWQTWVARRIEERGERGGSRGPLVRSNEHGWSMWLSAELRKLDS